MSFQANVLKVMIASPGDVAQERAIVTEELLRWNDANTSARQIVLLPVKWETHSTPQLGAPAQAIINEQLLDDVDIMIGIFGTRIGTPTEEYISGSVEEIKKHVAAGKTAKVYFSDVPVSPSGVDPEQYASVQKFREECQKGGLFATYKTLEQFKTDFSHHLDLEMNLPRYLWLGTLAPVRKGDDSALSKDALRLRFDEVQKSHISELLAPLNYMQRDLLRFLLLQGGTVRGDVILAAYTKTQPRDLNGLSRPLRDKGLLAQTEDRIGGYVTYTVNEPQTDVLRALLFPRQEENDTPFFSGIPVQNVPSGQ
jgi:hypothetical protein